MEKTELLPEAEREWERGFDGHARAQRLRMAALTFRQKLEWLEEMDSLLRRGGLASLRREPPCTDQE